MPPLAVLFDFDGVIADTENVHVAAWERTFAAMGWEVPPEVCARAAEEDDRAFLESVVSGRGVEKADIDGWVRRKQDLTLAMLADAPRVYPGVAECVRKLGEFAKLAVVTTTTRANVEAVLRAERLDSAFALIVAKEDVIKPKPDPSAYRLALVRLKIPAREAIALEGSPTGLAAARAVGVRALAIGHRRMEGEWTGESPYYASLDEVAEALRGARIDR